MSLLDRLAALFRTASDTSPPPAPVPPPPQSARFGEAAGATVDNDDDEWRRLTGDGQRDLAPMTHDRMQRLAHFLWETNLLANRLIELPVAYLLGQGVQLKVKNRDAQRALDRHWNDGLNAWPMKLPKRVRELGMFGEQCYPVFGNLLSGFVRIGYLDPAEIETVVTDPDNREQPIGIVTRKDKRGQARRYRVIVNVPETEFAETAREIRKTMTSGDCFYFRVNDLSSATRGRSDLLAQMDWLDAYDMLLFGEVDRTAALRAYIWDVTLAGATEEEVKRRAKEFTPPRSGAVRVHNEAETWKAEAPTLNSGDVTQTARLIRNHMLGGATVPEHWYGGAEDVNKSTGASMTEPTERMLDMRQQVVGHILLCIATYVLRAHWGALDKELTTRQETILGTLEVSWPELTVKDTTRYAAALMQIVSACAQAIQEGLVTRATAVRLIAALAARLGVKIDVESELEAAAAELAERGGPALDGLPTSSPPPVPMPDGESDAPLSAAA